MCSEPVADRIYKSGGRRLAHLWFTHSTEFWAQRIVRNALKWRGCKIYDYHVLVTPMLCEDLSCLLFETTEVKAQNQSGRKL